MWCTVGIALKRDSGHVDDGGLCEPFFQIVILRFAFSYAEAPTIVVDDDGDVVRVVECRGAALKRRIVKVPFRRRELPNEFRKVATIFVITGPTAFGGE